MPEIVGYLAEKGEFMPVVRCKSSQGENIEKTSSSEEDNQKNGKKEARNGIANDDACGCPYVESRPIEDGFTYTEGNGYEIDKEDR